MTSKDLKKKLICFQILFVSHFSPVKELSKCSKKNSKEIIIRSCHRKKKFHEFFFVKKHLECVQNLSRIPLSLFIWICHFENMKWKIKIKYWEIWEVCHFYTKKYFSYQQILRLNVLDVFFQSARVTNVFKVLKPD